MLKLCSWWCSANESEVGHWYNQPRRDLTLVNPAKRRISSAVLSLPHPLRSSTSPALSFVSSLPPPTHLRDSSLAPAAGFRTRMPRPRVLVRAAQERGARAFARAVMLCAVSGKE